MNTWRIVRVRWALTFSVVTGGCMGPEIGETLSSAVDFDSGECSLADSDPDTPVTWVDVRGKVLEKRCGCHMTPSGFGAVVGGLLLATRESALEGGRHAGLYSDAIAPGDPCGSYLIAKTGPTPPFGARMPLSSGALAGAERQLLIDWIAEGANP